MTKASKNQKILSISVAAYNLGEMIRENLDSFVNAGAETLSKLEILITNDGSTDDTAKIVKSYAKKYPDSIFLIDQQNQGAGSTVNSGLKHATGKYFKMIDGDDWVETKKLKNIIKKLEATDADLVLTDMLTYNEAEKRITDQSGYSIQPDTILNFSDVASELDIQMHNTMYKTELLKNHKIKLDNGFYTDIEYVLLPLPFVKTITYFNLPFYIYRVARAGQSMSKASMRKNAAQHQLVLTRLVDEYKAIQPQLQTETEKYLVRAIGRMANTELRVRLLKESDLSTKKADLRELFDWLKTYAGSDIYRAFLTGRKAFILKITHFRATKSLVKAVEKKFY